MANREKGKLSIRAVLKERDETLYSKIVALWDGAHELHERQRSREGHQQGSLHCIAVEDNLGKIISDEDKRNRFTPLELFLLSAAACYHDAAKSGDFDEKHALVVANDIFSNPEKYNVTDPEGKVLYYIIGSHDDDDVFEDTREIFPIGCEDVHVKILSALFRLADVLHTDHSRIPRIRVADDDSTEADKTRFRKLVKGWGLKGDSKIVLNAIPEIMGDYNLIAKGVSMLQEQIDCIVPVLRLENYPYEIICSCDKQRTHFDLIHSDGESIATALAETIIKADKSIGGTLHSLNDLSPSNELSIHESRIDEVTRDSALSVEDFNETELEKQSKFEYNIDIALSFAGEDRKIAEDIAKALMNEGVEVFYDEFHKADMWGKKLTNYFSKVYGPKARFVMLLISKHYPIKDWTDFELSIARKEAQSRKEEFILPVKLDTTKIVGIHEDVAYLDYNMEGIDGIVDATLNKLSKKKKINRGMFVAERGMFVNRFRR